MHNGLRIGAVVPARDEEGHVGAVVRELLALRDAAGDALVDYCVVCDNGSSDATADRARAAGAEVVREPTPGYGSACRAALAALPAVDIVLFTDGDGAFKAAQAPALIETIAGGADLAIGSRPRGRSERGALSAPQRLGNRVAGWLIGLLWNTRVTDLGPYRAIRADALRALDMRDRAYGWTVEMQVKAIIMKMRVVETPVDTLRRRFGKSKVGGTARGIVAASVGILSTIAALRWRQWRAERARTAPKSARRRAGQESRQP